MQLNHFIEIPPFLQGTSSVVPWFFIRDLQQHLLKQLAQLDDQYAIKDQIAIHHTAKIHPQAIIQGPAIISANCYIGPNALLRNGVWLGENVSIGAGVEVKQSVICGQSAIAHFNFIGDSLIGHRVNFEAGAIIANHFNERENKMISVMLDGQRVETGVTKFGALVGDDCKIGANAVLSPGTILAKGTVVGRLQLVDQDWQSNIQ
jgi:UDP-N-acetylglucosamine diphosphorylase / glucose-1-phosphate thymidylyltransferase / UDP-N-acetylgalactosamine diphosphorylase / glucosamine-1-phosphate N-acetyltransferase / galactosamine-1-phosphate N-acetyltransferase